MPPTSGEASFIQEANNAYFNSLFFKAVCVEKEGSDRVAVLSFHVRFPTPDREGFLKIDDMKVYDDYRDKKVAKVFMANIVDACDELEIKKVTLKTNYMGGWFWPSIGAFLSRKADIKTLHKRVEESRAEVLGHIEDDGMKEVVNRAVDAFLSSDDPQAIWLIANLKQPRIDSSGLGFPNNTTTPAEMFLLTGGFTWSLI